MATLLITNLTTSDVTIGDLYTVVPASSSITVTRNASELPAMQALQTAISSSLVSVSVTYSTAEVASGLLAPPASVQAQDMQPVDATALDSGLIIIRKALASGGSAGTADDVTIYAVNALPYKFRVVDAVAYISTAVGGSTLMAYTQASAGGTKLAEISSASTGPAYMQTMTATALATPGATEGLFIRRSDRSVVGEIVIMLRREN